MRERYKPLLFIILTLAFVWFLIILFSLQQTDEDVERQWLQPMIVGSDSGSSSLKHGDTHYTSPTKFDQASSLHRHPPHSLAYMKYFLPNHLGFSFARTLFYQFDLKSKKPFNISSIPKEQHEKETLKLGTINNPADQYIRTEGYNLFSFNLLISNRIGLIRPIPDTRNDRCKKWSERDHSDSNVVSTPMSNNHQDISKNKIKLQASVIICYYNEAPSALLRTIYTVLERSPTSLLKEIIVVDDYSEQDYDYNKVRTFVLSKLVTFIRTNRREGLIRARIFGASLAKGDVLIFLDSHVEANTNWLEPLLEAIQDNNTTIACPMIDLINPKTMIYSSSPMVKGGLNWALNFKWDSVPAEQLKTYDDFIKPIQSPTMAGGLYAIQREYFFHLGDYDSGMELWGGENIEMSLRVWLCGGRILILPCSRLGHIFRKTRPYGPEPDQPDSLLINSQRTARVWLDEYIYKYYEANPDARYIEEDDVSARIELRSRLKCRNFTYYLNEIYPDLKKDLDSNSDSITSDVLSKPKLFNLPPKRAKRRKRWHVDELRSLRGNTKGRKQGLQILQRYNSAIPPKLLNRLLIFNGGINNENFFNSRSSVQKLATQIQSH